MVLTVPALLHTRQRHKAAPPKRQAPAQILPDSKQATGRASYQDDLPIAPLFQVSSSESVLGG